MNLGGQRDFVLTVETVRPGRLPALLAYYKTEGFGRGPVSNSTLHGAWNSEFGALNRLYLLWECGAESNGSVGEPLAAERMSSTLGSKGQWVTEVEHLHLQPACVPLTKASIDPPGGVWDFRIYDVAPYRVEEYLDELIAVMSVRQKYSKPFGVWRQRHGRTDRIVHLWPYRDLDHRSEVRAAVAAEPAWQAFVEKAFAMLIRQRSSLLRQVDGLDLGR